LKSRTTRLLAATTLTGLLLAATACASPPSAEPNATPLSASATPVNPLPSATATATDAPSPTTAVPSTETRQSAPMETFTFPDGHISFDYFAGWTVTVKPGPVNSPDEQKVSFEATITDESGAELARVYSGKYGDGAAGPATRTVLDHSPVSGISDDESGEATEFGFAYDEDLEGGLHYFMDVREAHEFLAPDGSSGSNQIALPDRIMNAYAVLGDPTKSPEFATPAAAKAWMETGRYAQLKTMLLSLTYK
jgi:hypothetical protein